MDVKSVNINLQRLKLLAAAGPSQTGWEKQNISYPFSNWCQEMSPKKRQHTAFTQLQTLNLYLKQRSMMSTNYGHIDYIT